MPILNKKDVEVEELSPGTSRCPRHGRRSDDRVVNVEKGRVRTWSLLSQEV